MWQQWRSSKHNLSKGPTGRDAIFAEYYGQQRAVSPIRTISTWRWKLNWYDDGDKELYDLKGDPHELRNLAGSAGAKKEQAELEARLEKILDARAIHALIAIG